MFDIGWGEMVVIGVVALVAIGPKELPGVLRTAGTWVGKARRMAADFQNQFQEALREADIAEMKKQFDDAANAAASASPVNLLSSTVNDVKDALAVDVPDGSAPVRPAEPTPDTHVEALQHDAAAAKDTAAEAPAPAAPAASDKAS
jgi:sec-independent protein translocase protein TatB